jgi:GTPase KRas protein
MPSDIPVVVLGGGAVGKSCITIQYINGHFVDRYDATIEDVYRKSVEVDGQSSVLTIVDTAGQEGYETMREQYMKTGQGFVLVYSITDSESLTQLRTIYATLRRTKGTKVACIVVGNKVDLDAQRAVQRDEGAAFARSANCPFMEISAKDRLAVEEVFTTLVRGIRAEKGGSSGMEPSNPAGGVGGDGGANGRYSGGAAAGGNSAQPSGGNTDKGSANSAGSASQQSSASSNDNSGRDKKPEVKKKRRRMCTML